MYYYKQHPILKRGWHIAQTGEYCPRGNTAIWWSNRWHYGPFYGGYTLSYKRTTPAYAVRNHPMNKNEKSKIQP